MELNERIKQNNIFNRELRPEFPNNMLIELTNFCNHSCVFCANSKMTRRKGFMDEAFLIRILEEAFDAGTREVGFYATGEPFISKNLAQYVALAKKIGYSYVYITTNGALATPECVTEVIRAGIDSIKFSINAGSKETYKMIHGKDDFNIVLDNLKFINDFRKNNKLDYKIYVSYIVTQYTEFEKDVIIEKIQEYIDEIIFINVANQGGMMYEINDLLSLKESDYNPKKLPCSLLFNSLHITYEGYLTACCIDFQNYLTVADLKIISLKDAWNSENFMNLRKRHLENDIEGSLCNNCIYNKNDQVEPLIIEHATMYKNISFKKDKDIKNRLKN